MAIVSAVVPANTARDIVTRLNAEALKALALPEIREHLQRAGMNTIGSTPEQFAQQVRSDIARFVKIAREASIRAE